MLNCPVLNKKAPFRLPERSFLRAFLIYYGLLHNHLLAIDDIDTLGRGVDATALQVVNLQFTVLVNVQVLDARGLGDGEVLAQSAHDVTNADGVGSGVVGDFFIQAWSALRVGNIE